MSDDIAPHWLPPRTKPLAVYGDRGDANQELRLFEGPNPGNILFRQWEMGFAGWEVHDLVLDADALRHLHGLLGEHLSRLPPEEP